MIEKKTVIDQIEITRNGAIQIRFGLLLVEDGVEIDCKWHRTSIDPGGDIDAQIINVNAHLALMGKSSIESGRIGELKNIAKIVHTPDVIKAHKDRVEKAKS